MHSNENGIPLDVSQYMPCYKVRPAGLAAKHSIAYLVITGKDRYIGSKKSKSTKPRFYDGELQTLIDMFIKINWTLLVSRVSK